MKKLIIISCILGLALLIPFVVKATPIFSSGQVGTNPVAGSVLQTNGATSTWVTTSSLGISGGGGGGGLASTSPFTVGNLAIVSSSGALASAISSGTTIFYVDGNRSDAYTANGSTLFPYKTMGAAIAAASSSGFPSVAFVIAPAVYVSGPPVTMPNVPIAIIGNQSTWVVPSGLTITNAFDIYDMIIVGNVTDTDTSLSAIHQFTNGVITGNLTMNGNSTLEGMTFPSTTSTITAATGSLVTATNNYFQDTFIVSSGSLMNLDTNGIFASSSNPAINVLLNGQLTMNGNTLFNYFGPGIDVHNSSATVSKPNEISNTSIVVSATSTTGTLYCGTSSCLATDIAGLTDLAGGFHTPSGTNFTTAYDFNKSALNAFAVGTGTLNPANSLFVVATSNTIFNIQSNGLMSVGGTADTPNPSSTIDMSANDITGSGRIDHIFLQPYTTGANVVLGARTYGSTHYLCLANQDTSNPPSLVDGTSNCDIGLYSSKVVIFNPVTIQHPIIDSENFSNDFAPTYIGFLRGLDGWCGGYMQPDWSHPNTTVLDVALDFYTNTGTNGLTVCNRAMTISGQGMLGLGGADDEGGINSFITIATTSPQGTTSSLVMLSPNTLIGGSASGTVIAANPSTYNGDFINFEINSSTEFKISATGTTQVFGNLLDASGNKYSTSTGGGSGSVSTSSAITAGNFPFWATVGGALSGTSTLSFSTSTLQLSIGGASTTFTGVPNQSATTSLLGFGATIQSGNVSGTYIGINASSGYNGDLINFQVNSSTKFNIASSGVVAMNTAAVAGSPLIIKGQANNNNIFSLFENGAGIAGLGVGINLGTGSLDNNAQFVAVANGSVSGRFAATNEEASNYLDFNKDAGITLNAEDRNSNNTGAELTIQGTSALTSNNVVVIKNGTTNNPPQTVSSSLLLLGANSIQSGNASGTFLGANPASGYNGDFINFQVNSSTQFDVSATGTTMTLNEPNISTTSYLLKAQFNGTNAFVMRQVPSIATDFRIQGTTSSTNPILTLQTASGSSFYSDFTFNGTDAELEASNGTNANVNIRPLDAAGNINVWSPSQDTKLRIGNQNFSQAMDLQYTSGHGTLSVTSGNINVNSPLFGTTLTGITTFTGSSTVITPSIGGAIVGIGCDSATTTIDASYPSSTTAFITTPRNNPGSGFEIYSFLLSPGLIQTNVCSDVTATPTATDYVVKIIK